jgi:hypothetical protein
MYILEKEKTLLRESHFASSNWRIFGKIALAAGPGAQAAFHSDTDRLAAGYRL